MSWPSLCSVAAGVRHITREWRWFWKRREYSRPLGGGCQFARTNTATKREMYGEHETYALTAQEVMEELRRMKDWLDVDVRNQFDWKACEEEQAGSTERR